MSETASKTRAPRGKYNKGIPDAPIPEHIRLPDGRRFLTAELLKKRSKIHNHNLRKSIMDPLKPRKNGAGRLSKYTLEERTWQSQAEADELCQRYNISLTVARSMKSYARKLVNEYYGRRAETDECVIINHATNERIDC